MTDAWLVVYLFTFSLPIRLRRAAVLGISRQTRSERETNTAAGEENSESDKCGKKPPSGSPTEWWSGL